jgi:hypothetical protein
MTPAPRVIGTVRTDTMQAAAIHSHVHLLHERPSGYSVVTAGSAIGLGLKPFHTA